MVKLTFYDWAEVLPETPFLIRTHRKGDPKNKWFFTKYKSDVWEYYREGKKYKGYVKINNDSTNITVFRDEILYYKARIVFSVRNRIFIKTFDNYEEATQFLQSVNTPFQFEASPINLDSSAYITGIVSAITELPFSAKMINFN